MRDNGLKDQIKQAVFDAIMDHFGMDETDGYDQKDATELTNVVMDAIGPLIS